MEGPGPPQAGRVKGGPPLETPEEQGPAHTLSLDFQPPEVGESKCMVLKAPGLGYFVTAALENESNSYPQIINKLA